MPPTSADRSTMTTGISHQTSCACPTLLRAWGAVLLYVCLLLPLAASAQAPGKRIALVVGNSAYAGARLERPGEDARLIGRTLEALGFQVTLRLDVDPAAFRQSVDAFTEAARSAEVAFFYFAGHGVQIKGENYLLPVGATLRQETDYEDHAIAASLVRRNIEAAAPAAGILVLDACRDNPFEVPSSVISKGVITKGLARMTSASGVMVAFATDPDNTASDDGTYAQVLAAELRKPGQELVDVFRNTGAEVRRRTQDRQKPRLSEVSITQKVYLAGLHAALKPPSDCPQCPDVVVIPAGRFTMGSPMTEGGREDDESPQHTVILNYRLAVGRTEVTRAEFARFVQQTGYKTDAERGSGCMSWSNGRWAASATIHWRNPGFTQSDDHPVVCVSWNDAQAYVAWLNRIAPVKGYRLLSEAEWEYAARAGTESRYPWGDDPRHEQICQHANGADASARAGIPGADAWRAAPCPDGHARTAPVARFAANPWGLFDLHGNVWEWVEDAWYNHYRDAPIDGSPRVGMGAARRVIRGGGWDDDGPDSLRSANRAHLDPSRAGQSVGFRVARRLAD